MKTHHEVDDVEALSQLVPPSHDDDCSICGSWLDDIGDDVCHDCHHLAQLLGRALAPVRILTLYSKPSPMREWLTGYKAQDSEHKEGGRHARATLCRVVQMMLPALPLPVDGVASVVPSTWRQDRQHPLEVLLRCSGVPLDLPSTPLLSRGSAPIGHNQPSMQAYVVPHRGAIEGKKVILLDDVYTTGAHAQSAAATLRLNGAEEVHVVVLGRRINPDFDARANALWERQRARSQYGRTAEQGSGT